MTAATSGTVSAPRKSIASGSSAITGAAISRSAAPGPANTATAAPGSNPADSRSNNDANRSAGQTLGAQFAVTPKPMTGRSAGSSAAARARSSGAVHATGSGAGSIPSMAACCSNIRPGRFRRTTRCRAGIRNPNAEPRKSTTRSHQVNATARQSFGQCESFLCLLKMMMRSSCGIRA